VAHARGVGGEARVFCPFGVARGGAKARELSVVADGQQHVAVARAQVLVGRQAGVGVAHALRCLAGGQVARRLVGEQGHAGVEQGHVDVLARPLAWRACSAARMALLAYRPVTTSITATPTLSGPPPGWSSAGPVMLIRPHMACTMRS